MTHSSNDPNKDNQRRNARTPSMNEHEMQKVCSYYLTKAVVELQGQPWRHQHHFKWPRSAPVDKLSN